MATVANISQEASGSLGDLEEIIKIALKRTGSSKELDLCAYLSTLDRPFSPSTYLRLKDNDRQTLLKLIREKILDTDPYKLPNKIQAPATGASYTGKSLEECIKEAMSKVNALRATALCKYIPSDEGGYIHHFTFLKMKSSNPIHLRNMIQEHILDCMPKQVPPKKRNRRKQLVPSKNISFDTRERDDLDSVIAQAMHKMGSILEHEENLRFYLPQGNSFMYPSMYENLKKNNPRMLAQLIREYVIKPTQPRMIEWGKTGDYSDQIAFQSYWKKECEKPEERKFEQLLEIGNQLLQAFRDRYDFEETPRCSLQPLRTSSSRHSATLRCFQIIQNELIMKILRREIDQNLWENFVDLASQNS